jgi:hypothetical protein
MILFWKKEKKHIMESYPEKELKAIEKHISTHFGECKKVFHNLIPSPDLHLDIIWIEPTAQRNYHILVTQGMGSRKMNAPKDVRKERRDRAEVLITLPPDWKVEDKDMKWQWPMVWLNMLAELPILNDTWLGYGHTVEGPCGGNTELCGVMLTLLHESFGDEAMTCEMPNGERIIFYQVLPIYEGELKFKIENDAEALEDRFPDGFDMVVDVSRKKVV